MRVLVVDNYDSFVFNLVQYLGELGADCTVWRNDAVDLEAVAGFDGVLVSPGSGIPQRAGRSVDVVRRCADTSTPMLGVNLGHQALAVAYGATVDRAHELMHGKTSSVHHSGTGIFAGLAGPFTATRYHSLTVLAESIPRDTLEVTARTESDVVMAIRHRELPLQGVQFHPESILSEYGHRLLANWMGAAGYPVDAALVDELETTTQALQQAAG